MSTATWRRSSYIDSSGGDCLEVADGHTGIVPVRDSKRPEGPALAIAASAWTRSSSPSSHPDPPQRRQDPSGQPWFVGTGGT
ncbi:DUF397 domain-containing protein [Streptomyces sp. NPDC057908]|uniref:DUF397 domain-containing protein n=1 Tax=Streptomyces sp. NPDC057908 TaxID=3346276 RepID=UPI0036E31E3F